MRFPRLGRKLCTIVVSSPCNAILANRGESGPPCITPSFVGNSFSPSITPAFNQDLIWRLTKGLALTLSKSAPCSMLEALGDVRVKNIFSFACNRHKDGFNRIMTGPPRTKTIAVTFEARFPFRFECFFDQSLPSAVLHYGYAQGSLLFGICFIYPHSADGSGRTVDSQAMGHP